MDISKSGIKGIKVEQILRYFCIGVIDYIILMLIFPTTYIDKLKIIFPVDLLYILIPVLGITHYSIHRVFVYTVIESLLTWLNYTAWSSNDENFNTLARFLFNRRHNKQYFSDSLSEHLYLRWAMAHYVTMIMESAILFFAYRGINYLNDEYNSWIIIIFTLFLLLLLLFLTCIALHNSYKLEKEIAQINPSDEIQSESYVHTHSHTHNHTVEVELHDDHSLDTNEGET